MSPRSILAAVAAVATAVACSSASGGSASVEGSIGGLAVSTVDVAAQNRTDRAGAQADTTVIVSIANHADLCGAIQSNTMLENLTALDMSVSAGASALATGTYAVGQGTTPASASYHVTNSVCTEATPDVATAGSVTFTRVDSSRVEGSFDLTFPDGHVTGSFSAPVCNPGSAPMPTCSQ